MSEKWTRQSILQTERSQSSASADVAHVHQLRCQLSWCIEVASLALSLVLFATMIIGLWRLDGAEDSTWSSNININTVITLLSVS